MLELKNVNKTYKLKDDNLKALKDVTIKVEDGEIFGVIGHSGAGKSTLLRVLADLESIDDGEIIIDGINLSSLKGKSKRMFKKNIGVVFQGFNLLSQKNVYKNISFPLELSKHNPNEVKKRVFELLELVGLNGRESSYPSQLSGGQKQRVAIARALASSPKILLLDEFTSALDPHTTNQILKLLLEINQKEHVTILFITHELSIVKSIANRVAVIDNGRIVEVGEVKKLINESNSLLSKLIKGESYE